MSDALLFAVKFDGIGGSEDISLAEAEKHIRDNTPIWVHLNLDSPETAVWMREHMRVDDYVRDAMLAEETRPRCLPVGNDGVLLILRGMNLNENAVPEDMVSVRIWTDGINVVSVRRRQLKAVQDVRSQLAEGKGPKNASHLLCQLVEQLFSRMEPVMRSLDEETDEIEERVLESVDSALRSEITHIRKQAIIFRRYIAPQRDAIGQLRMSELSWLSNVHKNRLQESFNHVTRYVEDLDVVRERAQVIKDEIANSLADRLNHNMYILSVIAAIFLPLGFLTGLLGINVGGIPGADNSVAFLWFCGLLSAIVGFQIWWFKRKRWF